MDPIKEAFHKVKQDILFLKEQLSYLRNQIDLISQNIQNTNTPQPTPLFSKKPYECFSTDSSTDNSTQENLSTQTLYKPHISTDNSTNKNPIDQNILYLEALKPQNIDTSTRNKGVSTDRQTDSSTDRQLQNLYSQDPNSSFEEISKLLDSLDEIKEDIIQKFKSLTQRELTVFVKIYELEDQNIQKIDYKTLANLLGISESSIRDYVKGIISKGVPLEKIKENNKKIYLKIPQTIKKTLSLSKILYLREL